MAELNFTGERFTPETSGPILVEHLHRYSAVRNLCYEKAVLDIACGEGYGSNLLATVAASVVGVDISDDAIKHACERYRRSNLEFLHGECACIPLDDSCVDVVISFETIEHHKQHQEMMAEIKRVLKPKGLLVISSPDKHEHSIVPGYESEFHVKELFRQEFIDLVSTHFINQDVYGQRIIHGSGLFAETGVYTLECFTKNNDEIQSSEILPRPVFNICVASDGPIPRINSGVFEDPKINESARAHLENLTSWATTADEYSKSLSRELQKQEEAFVQELSVLRDRAQESERYAESLVVELDKQREALEQESAAQCERAQKSERYAESLVLELARQ
ncbi:MAG: SAM-dependent methyltransferase, partial [Desulfuromonas sp.]